MMLPEPLLTVAEVAIYLSCAEETVKRLVRRGLLPAVRVGPRLRFRRDDVERYLAARANTAAAPASAGDRPARPDHRADAEVLYAIAVATAGEDQLEQILATTLDHLRRLVAFTGGSIALVEGDELVIRAAVGPFADVARGQRQPRGAGIAWDVVTTGEPFLSHDLLAEGRRPTSEFRSFLAVPLTWRGAVLGMLEIDSVTPNAFTAEDVALLRRVALALSGSVELARRYMAEAAALDAADAARQRLQVLAEASAAFAAARLDLASVLSVITQRVAEVIGDACSVMLIADDGERLELATTYHPDPAVRERTWSVLASAPHRLGSGAIDSVVQSGRSLRLPTTAPDQLLATPDTDSVPGLSEAGIAGLLAVPLRVQERVLGALTLSRDAAGRPYTSDDQQLLQDLADRAALAIDNARLYQEATVARASANAAAERATFLAELSQQLAASLEDAETLARLTRSALPLLGDACIVYQQAGTDLLRRTALAHVDAAMEELLRNTQRYEIPFAADVPVTRVLRSGQTEVAHDVPDFLVQQVHPDAAYQSLVRRFAPRAYICAPLVARGRRLGAMAFIVSESARTYTADDVGLAEEVARRAALALDNIRLYQEAQAAVAAREQFLSVAAHELKTPLTTLLGNAQLLERRAARDGGLTPRHQRSVEVIGGQAQRLNRLVTALLDITRLESGRLSLERGPLDLSGLARRVVAEVRPTLAQHAIAEELPAEEVLVNGDELRLEQVLHNLLANAVKYSPGGGRIGVVLTTEGDQVRVHVSDQGIGIPPHDLQNIFQRFYRSQNAEAQQLSGMGIGLFVVHEIVALHGGRIGVRSVVGQGSTFTVELPRLI
jgi:excisionase family DNA binding protein